MKNYYAMLIDMNTTEIRLETLREKREIINAKVTSCGSGSQDVVPSGGGSDDKIVRYIIELSDIDDEIAMRERELEIIKKNLARMDDMLVRMNGKQDIQSRVFVMKFIEGLPVREIASRIPCDVSTVYRQINRINKKMNKNTSCKKMQKQS